MLVRIPHKQKTFSRRRVIFQLLFETALFIYLFIVLFIYFARPARAHSDTTTTPRFLEPSQMSNTPLSSPHPHGCSPAPSAPLPSPPISPARTGVVTFRSPAIRHLAHLDAWRRHSWEPGAALRGNPASDTRSVSLEDLDMEEMALVLGGALGCHRARDTRRSVTCEGSLSSLTEEEAGIETQSQLCSTLEVCM
ncbi:uncharacterized protein LOC128616062 isoform X2 [Ictalurus furcatus]|uniref:uncharacterized protein LOC128616062 isoform X2 n=1 Tax=Ictalurus furcatus TaxID=66913 RepID=UPI002350212C|nr:uncharacterized protein LOC128616062 isoform X2 [Ictalurus furcatus]